MSDVQPETDTSTLGDARQLSRCPCLSGSAYQDCCGPYHSGSADAPTAERLMRSRYSAFVLGDAEYLQRTWHPRTRPSSLELEGSRRWLGLEILATDRGGMFDGEGTVEFRARWRSSAVPGPPVVAEQRETSRFVRLDNRWCYLDAI